MASINYISNIQEHYFEQYFKLSKCYCKEAHFFLSVKDSIYNQYYNLFLPLCSGRQYKDNAHKLCKLFFLINYCWLAHNNQIPNDVLYSITSDKTNFHAFRLTLKNLGLIDYTQRKSLYVKKGASNTSWKTEVTSYSINEIASNIDFSSKKYITIDYFTHKSTVYNWLNMLCKSVKSNLKSKSSSNTKISTINTLISIEGINSCFEAAYPIINHQFMHENFVKKYQCLSYKIDGINVLNETSKLQARPAVLNEDGRYYHRFHNISRGNRCNLYLDDEKLYECFDVHNCHFTLLNCIFDNTIPDKEKEAYYLNSINGKFYENVASWVNNTCGANWTRDDAKLFCNMYINLGKGRIKRALKSKASKYMAELWVDRYFETNYPSIRNFILNTKNMHVLLSKAETRIIVDNMCKDLYEKHGIEAITLHDGLYVKESDYNKINESNISIVCMFNSLINVYQYL